MGKAAEPAAAALSDVKLKKQRNAWGGRVKVLMGGRAVACVAEVDECAAGSVCS